MPTAITRAPLRTVRPAHLRSVYSQPAKDLGRMERNGALVKLAHGTYTAKPDEFGPGDPWKPNLEDAGMAYATALYGDRVPVLVGLGAARHHHAIPRAIGVTVIAAPDQHRPVTLDIGGRIVFTRRDTETIDARPARTAIGTYLVATPEQTLIDLVAHPHLGGMEAEASEAARFLAQQIDDQRLERLLQRTSTRQAHAVTRFLQENRESRPTA